MTLPEDAPVAEIRKFFEAQGFDLRVHSEQPPTPSEEELCSMSHTVRELQPIRQPFWVDLVRRDGWNTVVKWYGGGSNEEEAIRRAWSRWRTEQGVDQNTPRDSRAAWGHFLKEAREFDAENATPKSWAPAILSPLAQAASQTELGRLFPFMSLARLCFRRDDTLASDVAPASIELTPGDEYTVMDGSPYGDVRQRVTLRTADASAAAATCSGLLDDW